MHCNNQAIIHCSDNNTVEIKASVRCVAPHMELEAKFVHWIDLAPMLQPRIGHGLVEAGTMVS